MTLGKPPLTLHLICNSKALHSFRSGPRDLHHETLGSLITSAYFSIAGDYNQGSLADLTVYLDVGSSQRIYVTGLCNGIVGQAFQPDAAWLS